MSFEMVPITGQALKSTMSLASVSALKMQFYNDGRNRLAHEKTWHGV